MVNLLSPKQRTLLSRLYVLRLVTVLSLALANAGLVTLLLLLPSYFTIHAELDQASDYVEAATALATERAKGQSPETLQRFQEEVKFLTEYTREPRTARILELVTTDRPGGVFLTSITTLFDQKGATVSLAGTARTRAELIAYSNALKKVPEFSNVVVPVSALVADVDSTFTVSLRWTTPTTP